MTNRLFVLASAAALALAGAGCATPAPRDADAADPYLAALYTGAPQPDIADHYALLYAPEQISANGEPFELVSYAGIEGARRAHERYTEEEAEALDGRCEQFVEVRATESLIDVASLCDVSLDKLVAFNPDISNVSYSASGAMIEIPGGLAAPKGSFAMTDALANLYTVEEGDSLEKIADKVGLTPAALANLNPGVFWPTISPGQPIRKQMSAPAAAGAYAPPPMTPKWEGYAGAQGLGGSDAASVPGITAHAPYRLGMVKSYGKPSGAYPEPRLIVDRKFAKPGEKVTVTAPDLAPDTEVKFYGAGSPVTARADKDGNATAKLRVGKQASPGGVVFEARPKGSDKTLYSERVGVVTLKKESGAAAEEPEE